MANGRITTRTTLPARRRRAGAAPVVSAAPVLARQDLARLIALGRQKGELSPADLQAALPIQSMSAEAIAQVVLDLDAAGIAVELEDLLPGRAHPDGIAPVPIAPAPGLPSHDAASVAPRPVPPPARGAEATVTADGDAAGAASPAESRRVRSAVLVAGLIVLVLMGAALIALGH
ncbi:hypothetical protein ASF49_04555 [Methylobacterium sp. Leaf104]|nr:hypothetical protein ASF49_04555 [Methylobacterium sp. Leaf104]